MTPAEKLASAEARKAVGNKFFKVRRPCKSWHVLASVSVSTHANYVYVLTV